MMLGLSIRNQLLWSDKLAHGGSPRGACTPPRLAYPPSQPLAWLTNGNDARFAAATLARPQPQDLLLLPNLC